MELPGALRVAIERELDHVSLVDLKSAAATLSQRYRAETRDGRFHLDAALAVKAYLATRLPATYAAVRSSFEAVAKTLPDLAPDSLLDIGSGPGTALWAAQDCWSSLSRAQMIEASDHARLTGQALAQSLPNIAGEWLAENAVAGMATLRPADVVTMAYVLDELAPPAIPGLVARLWSLASSLLVIVEPGTPAGWRRVLAVRQQLIDAGAHIVAPCPHDAPCPLSAPDWCHFARRLPRSRLHRLAKGGDAPFEDEKFIFVAASRTRPPPRFARVLAPPKASSGKVLLKLCQTDGSITERLFTKRDGQAYKAARRTDWGDIFAPF